MEKIFSINELEEMIKCIKKDNPHYIAGCSCGIFKFNEHGLIQHRHVGIKEFKTIRYGKEKNKG